MGEQSEALCNPPVPGVTGPLSTVSNALSLNINVLLRNLVNMIGVICFMLNLSAPLTLVTLASLPPTIIVSKVYGKYFKLISKKTQKALAEATVRWLKVETRRKCLVPALPALETNI